MSSVRSKVEEGGREGEGGKGVKRLPTTGLVGREKEGEGKRGRGKRVTLPALPLTWLVS